MGAGRHVGVGVEGDVDTALPGVRQELVQLVRTEQVGDVDSHSGPPAHFQGLLHPGSHIAPYPAHMG